MAKDSPKKTERQANKQAEALEKQERQDAILAKFLAARTEKEKAEDFLKAAQAAEDAKVIRAATEQLLSATERMKAARKEWNENFRNAEFEGDLATYEASVGTGVRAAEIMAGEGTTEEKVAALHDVVQTSVDTRETVAILQELNDSRLSPADLLVSDATRRDAAIKVVFPAIEANELINNLSLPENTPQHKAALEKIQAKHDQLQPVYEKSLELIGDLNEFDEQRETQKAKELLGRLGETFAEKPLETSIATLAVIGTLIAGIAIFTKKDGLARKILLGTAVGGAALFGINFLSGALSKDGQTLAQRYLYDADNWKLENISSKFKDQLSGLTSGNEHAFQAMMHLKDAKASTLAAAFENSLGGDPGQREIDPLTFFSTREIPRSEARKINARGLYEGLEAMMVKVAIDSGEPRSKDRDYLAKKGLELFKERYASGGDDIRLQYIVCDLILGVPMLPKEQRTSDGSIRKGAGAERVSGRVSESREAQELEDVFTGFGVEMDITHDGENYRFMGYPLDVEVEQVGEYKVYNVSDPLDRSFGLTAEEKAEGSKKKGVITIRKDANYAENASEIKAHVNNKVADIFKAVDPSNTLIYDVDKHAWLVQNADFGSEITHVTKGTIDKEIMVVLGLNGYPQIRVEGRETNYPSVDAAVEAAKEEAVKSVISKEMNYLLGGLNFAVESITQDPSGKFVEVEITYAGTRGYMKFERGFVTEIYLPFSESLLSQWKEVGRAHAENALNREAVRVHVDMLRAAFAAQYNEGGIVDWFKDKVDIARARNEGLAPLFYGRDSDWGEAVDLKMKEYEITIQSQVVDVLRTNPTPAKFERELARIVGEVDEEIGKLAGKAREIANLQLTGEELNRTLISETQWLNEFGYQSTAFETLMDDVEDVMERNGFDYVGPDGMSNARGIRDHIRLKIYEKSLPIPGIKDADLSSLHEDYMNAVLMDVPAALSVALESNQGNIRVMGVTLDKAISDSGIEAALDAIPSFEEYKDAPTSYYRSGAIPKKIAVGPSSGPSSAASARSERLRTDPNMRKEIEREPTLYKKLELAKKDIDRMYDDIKDVDFGLVDDHLDVFVESRVQRMHELVTDAVHADPINADAHINRALDNIEAERLLYISLQGRSNPEEAAMLAISAQSFPKRAREAWTKPSGTLIKWLTGNFEFEHWILKDNPTLFRDIMEGYFEKVELDNNIILGVSKETAQKYTNYYMWSLSKVLPNDKNWSLDNFKLGNRQVSTAELAQMKNAIDGIDSFEDWMNKGAWEAPVLTKNDTQLQIEMGDEAQKAEMRKEFMGWFDKNIDVSKWTRIDGDWPDAFKAHVVDRMLTNIVPGAKTSEELRRELNDFAKFVFIEQQYYEYMITGKVETADKETYPIVHLLGIPFTPVGIGPGLAFRHGDTLQERVRDKIDGHFKTEFAKSPRDPASYAASLEADLRAMIDEAEDRDDTNIDLGPFALKLWNGMDPIQVTP